MLSIGQNRVLWACPASGPGVAPWSPCVPPLNTYFPSVPSYGSGNLGKPGLPVKFGRCGRVVVVSKTSNSGAGKAIPTVKCAVVALGRPSRQRRPAIPPRMPLATTSANPVSSGADRPSLTGCCSRSSNWPRTLRAIQSVRPSQGCLWTQYRVRAGFHNDIHVQIDKGSHASTRYSGSTQLTHQKAPSIRWSRSSLVTSRNELMDTQSRGTDSKGTLVERPQALVRELSTSRSRN